MRCIADIDSVLNVKAAKMENAVVGVITVPDDISKKTGVSWQFPIECALCKLVFPNSKALAMHLSYEHRVLEEEHK